MLYPQADLSVIVPAHNEEVLIGQCIESIGQELANSRTLLGEVIVVANDCHDMTTVIAEDALAAFPELPSSVVNISERGKKNALNCGILAAHSDVILCVDADVEVACGAIEAARETIDTDGVHLVGGQYEPNRLASAEMSADVLTATLYEELRYLKRVVTRPHKLAHGAFLMYKSLDLPELYPGGAAVDDLWLSANIGTQFGLDAIKVSDDVVVTYTPAQCLRELYKQMLRYRTYYAVLEKEQPELAGHYFGALAAHNARVDGKEGVMPRWRASAIANGIDFDSWIEPFQRFVQTIGIDAAGRAAAGMLPQTDTWEPTRTTKVLAASLPTRQTSRK